MNASKSEPLVPSPFVRQIDNEDGAALLDVKQGLCFSMNPVGASIWRMLKQKHSPNQIAAELVAEYGIGMEQASQDVTNFINDLNQHSLLTSGTVTPPRRFGRLIALGHLIRGTRHS